MSAADELKTRIDVIEESYEFSLAYAAKGLNAEAALQTGDQAREFLEKSARALPELADLFVALIDERRVPHPERHHAFIEVLRRDAADALAAIRLVLAQPAVTSQMIDNLNAMIHLRALLTDVFLIDEILRPQPPARPSVAQ